MFYRQLRVGKNGSEFFLLKFATMLRNSPNMTTGTITTKDDPRVLPFGKLLRKTKINELPQLLNVLAGDMSLVGPRPLTPQLFHAYPEKVQERLKSIRPGLSGIGSIIFRSEEDLIRGDSVEEKVNFYKKEVLPYKGELEVWYVKNRSFFLYLMIILATILVILAPKSGIPQRLFPYLPAPPDGLDFGK